MALALEHLMRLHGHEDVEIAGRPAVQPGLALAGEADARAFLDAGRDVDGKRAFLLHMAGALAGLAGALDHAAIAAAGGAGALDGEEALLCPHLADTGAGRALLGLGAGFGARAAAGLAGHRARHLDLGAPALEGFL